MLEEQGDSESANNLKGTQGNSIHKEWKRYWTREEHKNLHHQGTRVTACSHCWYRNHIHKKRKYSPPLPKEGKITSIKCKRSTTKNKVEIDIPEAGKERQLYKTSAESTITGQGVPVYQQETVIGSASCEANQPSISWAHYQIATLKVQAGVLYITTDYIYKTSQEWRHKTEC